MIHYKQNIRLSLRNLPERVLAQAFGLVAMMIISFTGFSQPIINGQFYVGGTANEPASNAIQLADGDYLFYGTTESFGPGGQDMMAIRFNPDFTIEWQFTFGGTGNDYIYDRGPLLENSDGTIMLLGNTTSYGEAFGDMVLYQLNSAGALMWSESYGGAGEERAEFLKQTSDGGYLFGGSSDSYNHATASATERDLHLVKVTSTGTVQWKMSYGTIGQDDQGGNISTQIADGIQLNDGTYLICGVQEGILDLTTPGIQARGFMARLDQNGSVMWFNTYQQGNTDGWEGLLSMALHDGGSVMVSGITKDYLALGGNSDGVLMRVEIATGSVIWSRVYGVGSSGEDWFYKLRKENSNRYTVAIYTNGAGGANGFDIGLFAFDASGIPIAGSAKLFGNSGTEHGKWIEQTSDGGYLISGWSSAGPNGGKDALLVKIDTLWVAGCNESNIVMQSVAASLTAHPYSPTERLDMQSATITLGSQLPAFLVDHACHRPCVIVSNWTSTPEGCPGSADGSISVTLDNSSQGGPFSYSFNNGPSTPIALGQTITITGLSAGTYTFVITDSTGACSEIITIIIDTHIPSCCDAAIDPQYVHITDQLDPLANITSNTIWDGKYYIGDGVTVVVANGAVLDITNVDVVFGECAGIHFTEQAYLRANNSVFRPCNVDGTWKGLEFDGSAGQSTFDNMINESTFKNAQVALYFRQGADGVVSSNLFSNCNYGVRVDNNKGFNHPISGNRFVIEEYFPVYQGCYTFVNNFSSYGIYSISTRFLYQISQNEFINSRGTSNPRVSGIHQITGGGVFTSNTLSDMTTSVAIVSPKFYTEIENNQIEVNIPGLSMSAAILLSEADGPIVEINNNTISNNDDQVLAFSAIATRSSSNTSISNNQIEGFEIGIMSIRSGNFQISENQIENSARCGIYFWQGSIGANYITCNSIKMRTFINTRGILARNLLANSEVSSNCITDCSTSMTFTNLAGGTLPLIRNNYLYNYNRVGIDVIGHNGNIGVAGDPGMNTLWSNDNSAVDIQSTPNVIGVADNFGMFNISFGTVQINSNNPYHSTASCGHQIFNMPSQGNLNTDYVCDHIQELQNPLEGGGLSFLLGGDYGDVLASSSEQFNSANKTLASLNNADIPLLNEIISITSLTDNEIAMLNYNFHYRNSDYTNARLSLNQFSPVTVDETDYASLRSYDLDVLENGWSILTTEGLQEIADIENKESVNSNFAIALLNNTSSYSDYQLLVPILPDVVKASNIKNVEEESGLLNIYPTPSISFVFIELINNNPNGKIQLFDMKGQLIVDYKVDFVSGKIEMDIRSLNPGIYFVTLTDAETGIMQKGKLIKLTD